MVYLNNVLRFGFISLILRLDLAQQCVSLGYSPAMYKGRVYHNNVFMLGLAQESNKAAWTSAK